MIIVDRGIVTDDLLENDNRIIGNAKFDSSHIRFYGKNNIAFFGNKCVLKKSEIHFEGDNSIFFIGNVSSGRFKARLGSNSTIVIGYGCRLGTSELCAESNTNILIGNDLLCAFDVKIWATDAHIIFDNINGKRINIGKSIYIGDHVWIAYHAAILKDTYIYSGSIIGAYSVTTKIKVPSNCIAIGQPAKIVKKNISWDRQSPIHSDLNSIQINKNYIYERNSDEQFSVIEHTLKGITDTDSRLAYINSIMNSNDKNRFSKSITYIE